MKKYTGILTKTTLKACITEAKVQRAAFIGVAIKRRDSAGVELIVNPFVNFEEKLEYYTAAYDEDLTLKTAPFISIVGFGYGNTLGELGRLFA